MKTPWRNLSGLSKVMAIMATVAGISFGLCSANLKFMSDVDQRSTLGKLVLGAGIVTPSIVVLCLFGMMIVGLIAIIRSIRADRRPPTTYKGSD